MSDIFDFFSDLFTTDLWPARWHCGYWSDFHGWLYIGSDLAIWFSYFAIPTIILGYVTRKNYELKYTTTYILFAAFILLCGSTHLLDAAMFWTPMYKFNALIRFITGVVSLFTVYHLIQILPDAFRQKTSLALEREIARRLETEKKLADANEGLKAFAYMASHDLQEPLRKIAMFSNNIRDANGNHFDEKTREWLDKTIHSAERMRGMIRDLLHLSSVNDSIPMEETDMNDVINECLSELEMRITDANAQIEVGPLPYATANRKFLALLFTNLISNSIKFSRNRPYITIAGSDLGSLVEIRITDNGIGMQQEETSRIFLPFERLHPRGAFEGSGIGLAICKKIVDVHNGRIEVASQPGEGSTFTITLQGVKPTPVDNKGPGVKTGRA